MKSSIKVQHPFELEIRGNLVKHLHEFHEKDERKQWKVNSIGASASVLICLYGRRIILFKCVIQIESMQKEC